MECKGNIQYINLTDSTIKVQAISEETRRLFLGGRGVNMLLLYNHISPSIGPMDADNALIIGAGLLSGLHGPSTARCSISGKSPETGLLGDSNIGGHFAAQLRKSGFDHIVITGYSSCPAIILIEDGNISIENAEHLWGKDAIETAEIIENSYGKSSAALVIGQAGENLVRFASVRSGWKNSAGRTGMGCLMGKKKIKAIVAIGNRRNSECGIRNAELKTIPLNSEIRNPKSEFIPGLRKLSKHLNQKILHSRIREVLHENGTPFLFDLHNYAGIVRTHNGQLNLFEKGRSLRSGNLKRKYYESQKGCFSCVVQCRHRYAIKNGPKAGITGEGPEYGTLGAFGPICGISDLESILVINDRLNRYGLDSSSTGNIIAWTIELFKRGIITTRDTGGLMLDWGDEGAILELIDMIAFRQSFGDILADGAKEASKKIGKDSDKYLIWSKFLPQSDAVDVRAHKGFALGVATSTRGADHLRSRPTLEALNLPEEQLEKIYGGHISSEPTSYLGKARMVWWSESLYAVADALGICRFVIKFNNPDLLGFEEFCELIAGATGLQFSYEELFLVGRRIITLERMFLAKHGICRKHDTLPERYFQPMPLGLHKGEKIDKESFDKMLDEYYELHEWDRNTGIPTKSVLEKLQLATYLI